MLTCECIFGARAVGTCTHKGHDLPGLPGSLGPLQLCPSLRDKSVGGCAMLWDSTESASSVHMGMTTRGQHPSGAKFLGKNKIDFAVQWS